MKNKKEGRLASRRRWPLHPAVWISVAQAIWIAVLVGWIVYVAERNERLAELAEMVRIEGFQSAEDWSLLVWGVVMLVALFVAMVGIMVGFTRYWSENRAIHSFVSTISHELRTPLASIRLYLETIQAHEDLTNDERNEFFNTILADVERLSASIDAILAASRIERRGIRFALSPIDLGQFVEQYYQHRQPHVQLRRRKLTLGEVQSATVMANAEALGTVLNNLVENAVRYSNEDTDIVLSVARDRNQAKLEVADAGRGIQVKEIKHLFKMFYRGSNRSGAQGTGLGLYIVRGLVKAMNGQIVIKSEGLEKGAQVTMNFPLQEV